MPDNSLAIEGKLALIKLPEAKRPFLVRIRRRKGRLSGVMQNGTSGSQSPDAIAIDSINSIICVFPNDPPFGRAYNIPLEPYVASERLRPWGNVTYYRKLSETEQRNFQRGMIRAGRRLHELKINYLLPLDLEVRQSHGKAAGMYIRARGDGNHHIIISPTSFVDNGGAKHISRIGLHEIGHPGWQLYMTALYKARWVRMYHGFNKIRALSTEDLRQQLTAFSSSRELPSAYRKDLAEDAKIVFDAILDWIKKAHHLELKFLDILVSAGGGLGKYWPRSSLHLSELVIPVTAYSAKNPEEFWCESFSLYAMGETLPRSIRGLVRRTIRRLQPR